MALKQMIIFAFLGLSISPVLSLECYQCTHNTLQTSNPVLGFVLKQFNKFSNEHCKLDSDDDYPLVNIRRCPKASYGKIMICGAMKGLVTAHVDVKVTDLEFHYATLDRDCIEVDPDDQETSLGCHDRLPSTAHDLLKKSFEKLNIGNARFDGRVCYYNHLTHGDFGIPMSISSSLKCPACTYNTLDNENQSSLKKVLEVFNTFSNSHCKLENDDDVYGISFRHCEIPPKGKQSKCVTLTGTVEAKLSFTSIKFKYHTYSRECITVDKYDEDFSDGCHTSFPSTANHLIEKTFEGVNAGNMKFNGQACYSKTEPYVGAAPSLQHAPLLSLIVVSIGVYMLN